MAHLSSYNIWIPNQQVTYNHRSSIFHQKHFNQNPPKLGQKIVIVHPKIWRLRVWKGRKGAQGHKSRVERWGRLSKEKTWEATRAQFHPKKVDSSPPPEKKLIHSQSIAISSIASMAGKGQQQSLSSSWSPIALLWSATTATTTRSSSSSTSKATRRRSTSSPWRRLGCLCSYLVIQRVETLC